MQPRDFSKRTSFPGNEGNNFDLIFKPIDYIQALPLALFGLFLFGIALLASRFDLVSTLLLFAIYVTDWVIIALLPQQGMSYGPSKPPVFMLAVLRAPFALLPFPWWLLVELVGTALVIYGFWFEPHRIALTHETMNSPKLGFSKPLRVLHLADIHVERITNRERALLDMAKALAPDLILFSGDFLNLSYTEDALAQEHARSILAELDAPLGVYAVSGSPAVDPPQVVSKLLDGMHNIRWLRGERAVIEHEGKQIEIVGLDCTHRPFVDGPNLLQALNDSGRDVPAKRPDGWEEGDVPAKPPDGWGEGDVPAKPPDGWGEGDVPAKRLYSDNPFRILLYHTPDLAPEAAQAGLDLQLSGHTHGGQVRIPYYGALYAASLYGKRFESGRRQVGNLTLYVSRGIGLEGGGAPRLRFNCPPEVILWELQ